MVVPPPPYWRSFPSTSRDTLNEMWTMLHSPPVEEEGEVEAWAEMIVENMVRKTLICLQLTR